MTRLRTRILPALLGLALILPLASLTTSPAYAKAAAAKPAPTGAKVDLNAASQKELEALPGVGAATAKKIIAGRPYASVQDLAKAGVPAKTIETLTPLVTAGGAAAAAAAAAKPTLPRPAPAPMAPAAPAAPMAPASPAATASSEATPPTTQAVPPPAKGMVWVNLETKIFHREGDPWYGRTKRGQYMSEADALKMGAREAKKSGGAHPKGA